MSTQPGQAVTHALPNLNTLSNPANHAVDLTTNSLPMDGAGETLAPMGVALLSGFQNPPNSLASSLGSGSALASGVPSVGATREYQEYEESEDE